MTSDNSRTGKGAEPFNIFCSDSGASWAAVYPCSEAMLRSAPYWMSSRQACTLPCFATRCSAVRPWLSTAFTWQMNSTHTHTQSIFMALKVRWQTIKLLCTVAHKQKYTNTHNHKKIFLMRQMPLYLGTMLKKTVHQIKMTLICCHMQRCLQPFDSTYHTTALYWSTSDKQWPC